VTPCIVNAETLLILLHNRQNVVSTSSKGITLLLTDSNARATTASADGDFIIAIIVFYSMDSCGRLFFCGAMFLLMRCLTEFRGRREPSISNLNVEHTHHKTLQRRG
jgi:hypothetical protein